MNIIDMHVHPRLKGDPIQQAADMIELGQKHGISKMGLLGDVLRFGDLPSEKEVVKINDNTIEVMQRWPEIFFGFCFLNPANDPKFIADEIDRCINEFGLKGVKLEISINVRDKRLDTIMEKLGEHNGILVHHCWYKNANKYPGESDPSDIADLAGRFSDIRIVMCHLAGCGIRGVQDIKRHKNVYIDTSGGQPEADIVEYAIKHLGAERILYGSDATGRDFAVQLGRIYGANMTKKEEELILCGNSERLFGC